MNHPVWQMSLRQYAEAKKHGRIRSGVETPHNVWRHSFASYLLAKTKSLPTVGYLMQHRHTTTTEIYEGVAKEADAAVYFGIMPSAADPNCGAERNAVHQQVRFCQEHGVGS
jgi:site-specific recombinase XerD